MSVETNRKILAIDDSRTDLMMLEVHLTEMGLVPLLEDNSEVALERAAQERPDLILLDIMMPGIDGYELCRRLKDNVSTAAIPIIIVSANTQSDDIIAGLECGAIDYITKPFNPGELRARINAVCRVLTLQERLLARTTTDELTGLVNRTHFGALLEREILQARYNVDYLSLIMLRLDHLQAINKTYGHLAGDSVLQQCGALLNENSYPLDIPARFAGRKFAVILPRTPPDKAILAAQRLHRLIANSDWQLSTEQLSISACIGVATMRPQESLVADEMIERSDAACRRAMDQGGDCPVHWGADDFDQDHMFPDISHLQSQVSTLTQELRYQTIGSLSAFVRAMEVRDPYLIHHSQNVQTYAQEIATELSLAPDAIEKINIAAQLHDIGKIGIPDHILQKPTKLTAQEYDIIKQHSLISVRILEPHPMFRGELPIIRHHHERFDGNGYPDGLSGRDIPFDARILALADSFDAITSDRVYHRSSNLEDAKAEIIRCSGAQFDPDIVDAFLSVLDQRAAQWPLEAVLTS